MPGRFGPLEGDNLDGLIEFLRTCSAVSQGQRQSRHEMTAGQFAAALTEGAVLAVQAYRQISLLRIALELSEEQLAAAVAREDELQAQIDNDTRGYFDHLITEIMADRET